MTSKADLRKMMIEKRMAMAAEERTQACGYVCEKLLATPLTQSAVVAGYRAIQGEVDIGRAMLSCHDRRIRLCLPSITVPEKILRFLEWRPKMPLKRGVRGVMEPAESSEIVPNVVWAPMLAFDRAGYRLGYGGGYYDATIAHLRKKNPYLLAIGVAFAFQEVEALPREPHDAKLDMIVTEKELIQP